MGDRAVWYLSGTEGAGFLWSAGTLGQQIMKVC